MAVFKCKMCGGALDIKGNETVAVCEYCGTRQTLPRLDDGRRANLYDRANHFRRNNEYDKAMSIYEQLLNEDGADAEAYWSLVLCRYGIEYVEDPYTRRRVPTVNRAQYTSVFDDEDYKSALKYADGYQKSVYEEEAKAINEIQKGILEVSRKEEPFDIFICYKETDADGRRTPDSVLAGELYQELTKEGFKVFFSRITLEDKLGTAYEPYIFAALNSAKVMVVLGTKPEYFNAVWVKNEWSRYLALIKNGAKKTLIPAYRGMDPYDLPDEFSNLQAQDMSKLGFMQDLIRGIKKITETEKPPIPVKETVVINSSGIMPAEPLLKRASLFLSDGDFEHASEYCEKVLDIDPENAEAYLYKMLAELKVRNEKGLSELKEPFISNSNYKKIMMFGDETIKDRISGYSNFLLHNRAEEKMEAQLYADAAKIFEKLRDYKDSEEKLSLCRSKLDEISEDYEKLLADKARSEKEAKDTYRQNEKKGRRLRRWGIIGMLAGGVFLIPAVVLISFFPDLTIEENKLLSVIFVILVILWIIIISSFLIIYKLGVNWLNKTKFLQMQTSLELKEYYKPNKLMLNNIPALSQEKSNRTAGKSAHTDLPEQFRVLLINVGPNRLKVISLMSQFTGLSFAGATKATFSLPAEIKRGVPKDIAENIKTRFEILGAYVSVIK